MQFARSGLLRPHDSGLLPFTDADRPAPVARPRRRIDLREVPLRPQRSAAHSTQTCSAGRIRYAAELLGAGIMIAGFLALAIVA